MSIAIVGHSHVLNRDNAQFHQSLRQPSGIRIQRLPEREFVSDGNDRGEMMRDG